MTGAQMGDHASLRGPGGEATRLALQKLSTQDGPQLVLWTRWLPICLCCEVKKKKKIETVNETQTVKGKQNVSEVMTQISNAEVDLVLEFRYSVWNKILFSVELILGSSSSFYLSIYLPFFFLLRLRLNPGYSLAVSWALLTWWGGKTVKLAVSVSLLTRLLLVGFVRRYVSVCVFVRDSVALQTWIKPWIAAGRKDMKRGQMEVNQFTVQGKVRALLWHRN